MERSHYSIIVYYGTWLSLLFAFLIDKVSVQSITVEADQGDSVILLCSAGRYERDVFWRHENTKSVYDVIDGKVDFHDQDAAYRGRVKGFHSEFAKGNYSIRLRDVKPTDTGTYSCQIPDSITLYVELNIKEHLMRIPQHKSVQTSGGVRRQSDNLSRFSAALLGLSVWFCCSIYDFHI